MFDFRSRSPKQVTDEPVAVQPECSASIVHALPGRLRIKVPGLSGSPARQDAFERQLRSMPHIGSVKHNRRCASFVLEFDPRQQPEVIAGLQEFLPDLVDARPLQTQHGLPSKRLLADDIAKSFRTFNREVEHATGGMDLGVLLPLGLFLMGVIGAALGIFKARRLTAPDWYDYWWFAFNTFVILNVTLSQSRFAEKRSDESPTTGAPLGGA